MTGGGLARTGALTSLAACFFISGLLRAGEVVAALPAEQAKPDPVAAGEIEPKPDLGTLAAELARQRAELERRRNELDDRGQMLAAIEARLRQRLEELAAARDRLAEVAALADDAAGKDLRHLGDMYRRMKPKQAGRIFDTMAPEFAAGFLGQLPAEPAAQILASMDPAKAYAVSLLLAGRNVGRESVIDGARPEGSGAPSAPLVDSEPTAPGGRPTTPVQGSSTDLP